MVTLELPGRGSRVAEPLIDNMTLLVEDLYEQIQEHLCSNYMIFSHSMGGIMGNLLIQKLRENRKQLPNCFLVTGCRSPKQNDFRSKIHHLNKENFQQEIINLGGMPDEIINSQELLDYMLPILKSDIKALEETLYKETEKYETPIIVFYGSEESIKEEDILDWELETSSTFKYQCLEGNHFFILNHLEFISGIINKQLLKNKSLIIN